MRAGGRSKLATRRLGPDWRTKPSGAVAALSPRCLPGARVGFAGVGEGRVGAAGVDELVGGEGSAVRAGSVVGALEALEAVFLEGGGLGRIELAEAVADGCWGGLGEVAEGGGEEGGREARRGWFWIPGRLRRRSSREPAGGWRGLERRGLCSRKAYWGETTTYGAW